MAARLTIPSARDAVATARAMPPLLLVLAMGAAAISVAGAVVVLASHPFMVDLEIPLRAADRWAHGGQPYLASAFSAPEGADLPFLYPPPVLPVLAPLAALPRLPVQLAWLAALLAGATWLLRRLGFPWWAVPLGLCWGPSAEALVGGNVQPLLVSGFVAVFFGRPGGEFRPAGEGRPGGEFRPARRDVRSTSPAAAAGDGVRTVITPALKISQPHGWIALLRERPSAALLGLALAAIVALATLPFVGIDAWRDWIAQLGRAADPTWPLRGSSLVQLLPGSLSIVATAVSVALVLAVPRRRLGSGAGLLLVLGAPSLRTYGAMFVLPALLEIRREVALAAAILIGLGVAPALWAGIAIVTLAWVTGLRARPGPSEGPQGRTLGR